MTKYTMKKLMVPAFECELRPSQPSSAPRDGHGIDLRDGSFVDLSLVLTELLILASQGSPENTESSRPVDPSSPLAADEVVQPFVEHWGGMARSWGINATMGELFALLYLTGVDWDAEGLRARLGVSRGNVSMNLRELMAWGLVHKVTHLGERREFYRAEGDVWTLFQRILQERKRRELDPTLAVLDDLVRSRSVEQGPPVMQTRLVEIQRFFTLIDAVANRVLALRSEDVEGLSRLLDEESLG